LIYKNLIRKFLYQYEPEKAHHIAETSLRTINKIPFVNELWRHSHTIQNRRLEQNIFGQTFSNPVGLGAGFDKNGSMIKEISSIGFGFTEVGTITPKPQEGNPKPRIQRHVKEETLQNAMGFNNLGAEKILENLKNSQPFPYPVGVNIGKNKRTPEKHAINDYIDLIAKFESIATYLVINISSPNTPNLRDLQNKDFIKELFYQSKKLTSKPILLKIAPDMDRESALMLSKFAVESGASGIVATNTTIDHSLIKEPASFGGGLSGKVLKEKSLDIFDAISSELYGETKLISVGGISTAEDVYQRIRMGADLTQIYSAFIFKGPYLIKTINSQILKLLVKDGFGSLSEARGADRNC
jgi:dihydroorotate dehydrogenase